MTTRKKVWVKHSKVKFKGRSYTNYVKEDKWNEYFVLMDPNLMWDFFEKTITKVIDPVCPIKTFVVPEAREPWITNEASKAIRDKDKLLRKAKKKKSS